MRVSPRGRRGTTRVIFTPNESLHRFSVNLRIKLRQPEEVPQDVVQSIDRISRVFTGPVRKAVRFYLMAYVSALTYGETEKCLGSAFTNERFQARTAALAIREAALDRKFHCEHFDPIHVGGWFRHLVARLIAQGPLLDAPLPPEQPPASDVAFDPHPGWVVGYPTYEPSLERRSSLHPRPAPLPNPEMGRVIPPWLEPSDCPHDWPPPA